MKAMRMDGKKDAKSMTANSLKADSRDLIEHLDKRGLSYKESNGGQFHKSIAIGSIEKLREGYKIANLFNTVTNEKFLKALEVSQKAANMILQNNN